MKSKILELLGFGIWENALDLNELHIKKADSENLKMLDRIEKDPLEIDDHNLHIERHIAFMLTEEFEKRAEENPAIEKSFLRHINLHKKF